MNYQIGTKQFKTKKDIHKYIVNEKLNIHFQNPNEEYINFEDTEFYKFLLELFKHHYYYEEKFKDMIYIYIERDEMNHNNLSFYIWKKGHKKEQIGYTHPIKQLKKNINLK